MMESGDNPASSKHCDHKSKSRVVKKERSLSFKLDRGDEAAIKRSRKSYRSVPNDRKSEWEKLKTETSNQFLLENNVNYKSGKTKSGAINNCKRRIDKSETVPQVKRETKDKSPSISEKSKGSGKKVQSSKKLKKTTKDRTESILKDSSVLKSEHTNNGVTFEDRDLIKNKKKLKPSNRSKSESKDKSGKPKSSENPKQEGKEKSINWKSEKHDANHSIETSKKECKQKDGKSSDRCSMKIKNKSNFETQFSENIIGKQLDSEKNEKKKNKRQQERKDKKKVEREENTKDLTIIYTPETKIKKSKKDSILLTDVSRGCRFVAEETDATLQSTKKKTRVNSESKACKEKEQTKERKKKLDTSTSDNVCKKEGHRPEKYENRRPEKSEKHKSEKSDNRRSDRHDSRRSEKTESRRSDKQDSRRPEKSESRRFDRQSSRRSDKSEGHRSSDRQRSRKSEKTESRRSDKRESRRLDIQENHWSDKQKFHRIENHDSRHHEERKRRRSHDGNVSGEEICKNKERKKKSKQKQTADFEVIVKTTHKETTREEPNSKDARKQKKLENLLGKSHQKTKEITLDQEESAQASKKQINDSIKTNPVVKSLEKEESIAYTVNNDKYIKVSNKENILKKGVQDLTVKELYLMENLRDYELKMNEQLLKKMKKKKRDPQSENDNLSRRLKEKSNMSPVTNICRLPSVKEIFKISNLADYERKYKEMQDKKRRRCTDTVGNNGMGLLSSAMGRKKLTKFSLESKEDSLNFKEKISPSNRSSQWLLNNFRGATLKNEGAGEEIICNLLCQNEKRKRLGNENYFESGDIRAPSRRDIVRGLRTTSKTKLTIMNSNDYINSLEKSSNYFKFCEKFRQDIREDSKKLLQNIAENKSVRISIKDNSLQSIKKKPSLSSSEGFCGIKNFDYVLLQPKKSLETSLHLIGDTVKRKYNPANKNNFICQQMERKKDTSNDFPWKMVATNEKRDYSEIKQTKKTFDKHVNKNAGVFIKNTYNLESTSPEDFFNVNAMYRPQRLSLGGNFSRCSIGNNINRGLSNSSYTLSMFERDKESSDLNSISQRHTDDLKLLKRCNVSREDPEMDILQMHDNTSSRLKGNNRDAWFQRSATLERIINEIEESPEKDTNSPSNVLRECRFNDQTDKTFSEIEKSQNVLLSYISHVNYSSQKRDKNNSLIGRDDKNARVIFNNSAKGNKVMLNRRKYYDSLSCLRDLPFLEGSRFDSSLSSGDKIQGHSCLVCSKSCMSMRTLKNERKRKSCKNVFKTSLQSTAATYKRDLNTEEESNALNTKLVIKDPAKKSNILQIRFCGKLNINFNKGNIELGNVDSSSHERLTTPMEIRYNEIERNGETNKRCQVYKKNEEKQTNSELEDHSSSKTAFNDQLLTGRQCASKNGSCSSRSQIENSLSNCSYSVSNSSKTVVFAGKKEVHLSRGIEKNECEIIKEKELSFIRITADVDDNSKITKDLISTEENKGLDITKTKSQRENCLQTHNINIPNSTLDDKNNSTLEANEHLQNCNLNGVSETRQESLKNVEQNEAGQMNVNKSDDIREKKDPPTEKINFILSNDQKNFQKENILEEIKVSAEKNEEFVKEESLENIDLMKNNPQNELSCFDTDIQTALNAKCATTSENQKAKLCDVETCTSPVFGSLKDKENSKSNYTEGTSNNLSIQKEHKSYSFSSDCMSKATSMHKTSNDETSNSSKRADTMKKEDNNIYLIESLQEGFQEHSDGSLKTPARTHVNVNFKLPLPKITTDKSRIIESKRPLILSESNHNVVSINRDPSRLGTKSPILNSQSIHYDKEEIDKATRTSEDSSTIVPDDKKKLLLSQSEEDAFKYLLLKGIGRTDVLDNKLSTESHEFECSHKPKAMFSAIKTRMKSFKNKASDFKLSEPSCVNTFSNSKMCKPCTIGSRTENSSQETGYPSCSLCSCGQQIHDTGTWGHQIVRNTCKHMACGQFRAETQFSHTPNNHRGTNLLCQKTCREDSTKHSNYPRKKFDYHVIDKYDQREMEDGTCQYGYRDNFGNEPENRFGHESHLFGNRAHDQFGPRQVTYDSFESSNRGLVDNSMKQFNGREIVTDVGAAQFSGRDYQINPSQCQFENSNFCEKSPWTGCLRDYLGNPSMLKLNSRNIEEIQHFSSGPLRNQSCEFKPYEYTFSNNKRQTKDAERQQFSNNTFPQDKFDQKHKSTKLTAGEDLHKIKQLNQNIFYSMEQTEDKKKKEPVKREEEQEKQYIANFDKKKYSKRYKFSKQASKLWKSLFKKNKKFSEEVLEYETIPPEQLLGQRPKTHENKLKIKNWLKKISQSKTTDFQNVQDKLFKKLNKIMTSEVTMPLQEVFDIIQKPQFHKDNHSYSGRKKFDRVNTSNYLSDDGHYIMITEQLNVRGFLVSIGLKDDVAWEAQASPELNARLQSAITEARSWVNKITMSQGLLIYILAIMTPSEVDNYYLQIVEAIINSRISNVGTLLSVMMVLKRYERGKYGIKTVISKEHVRDLVPKQISETEKKHQENRARFILLYNIAKKAALKINIKMDKESAGLLARLTASYSPGLKPYLSLLAHYIAQKIISNKGQLSMAVSYLQNLSIKNFDQQLFEQNCGLVPNKVVLKGSEFETPISSKCSEQISKRPETKHPNAPNSTDRIQASWVKRKRIRHRRDSFEKSTNENSILERKPSTMDLLREQNKS